MRQSARATFALLVLPLLGAGAPPQPTTVAVCVFRALKSDAATDWIGAGIQQSITTDLGKSPSIALRDLPKEIVNADPAALAARRSNIDVVVVGTFQVSADEVRATGRVLQASGHQIALVSAKASLKEVFRLQDDLTKQIHDVLVRDQAPSGASPTTAPAGDVEGTVTPIPFPGSLLERDLTGAQRDALVSREMAGGWGTGNSGSGSGGVGGGGGMNLGDGGYYGGYGGGLGWGGGSTTVIVGGAGAYVPYYFHSGPMPPGSKAGGMPPGNPTPSPTPPATSPPPTQGGKSVANPFGPK